jgi:hypothetical protein
VANFSNARGRDRVEERPGPFTTVSRLLLQIERTIPEGFDYIYVIQTTRLANLIRFTAGTK